MLLPWSHPEHHHWGVTFVPSLYGFWIPGCEFLTSRVAADADNYGEYISSRDARVLASCLRTIRKAVDVTTRGRYVTTNNRVEFGYNNPVKASKVLIANCFSVSLSRSSTAVTLLVAWLHQANLAKLQA